MIVTQKWQSRMRGERNRMVCKGKRLSFSIRNKWLRWSKQQERKEEEVTGSDSPSTRTGPVQSVCLFEFRTSFEHAEK